MPIFTCAILGSGGVGKTSFIKRLRTGEFSKKYEATENRQIYDINFKTQQGLVHFLIWDTAKTEDLNYLNLNCAIILTDLSSKQPLIDIMTILNAVWKRNRYIPIVICRNKVEWAMTMPIAWQLIYEPLINVQCCNISVKKSYNCELPFIWLCRTFFGDPQLKFLPQFAVDPPHAPLNLLDMLSHKFRLEKLPLPEEDNDW